MQNDTLIAVDLAKSVFEVAVSHQLGKIGQRERLSREKFLGFFVNRPAAVVIMEACGTSHSWARKIEPLGHKVVLLPPSQVRPYVLRNKTDRTDVRGMLEAYRNEDIKPVPIKSIDQQVLGSLHRLRAAWIKERTAKINTLRGILRELGCVIPVGARKVVPQVWLFIEDAESEVPGALRESFARMCDEIRTIEESIEGTERQLRALTQESTAVQRLESVPGIGLLTATALVAFIGDVHRFPSGRHMASFLGLTPREYSSGSMRRLGRISKRGDAYLRTLLVHGARSALFRATKLDSPDRLRSWALERKKTAGHNKAIVALANKLARTAWAVLKYDRDYVSAPPTA